GSGSGWSRIASRSRASRSARTSTTRRRFSRWRNWRSMSSRMSERRPARRRQGCSGIEEPSTRSESTSTGARGAAWSIAETALRAKAGSSLTTANSSPGRGPRRATASRARPPGMAWKPAGRARDSPSWGTHERTSSSPAPIRPQSRAISAPSQMMKWRPTQVPVRDPGGPRWGGQCSRAPSPTGPQGPEAPGAGARASGADPLSRRGVGPVQRIYLGDVQGCADELDELIARARDAYGTRWERWCVGDLVNRGPESLRALATVREVVDAGRGRCVLGNHELTLLRVAFGLRDLLPLDTFGEVLVGPDASEWIEWLRRRRLVETGRLGKQRVAMGHAAVHPEWSLDEVRPRARRAAAAPRRAGAGRARRGGAARPPGPPRGGAPARGGPGARLRPRPARPPHELPQRRRRGRVVDEPARRVGTRAVARALGRARPPL